MEPESLYVYTKRNLLDQPEYYMFSTYHGQSFLRGYFQQRIKDIADFEQAYMVNLVRKEQSATTWLYYWKNIIEQNKAVFSTDMQTIHTGFLPLSKQEQGLPGLQSISELSLAINVNTKQVLRLLLKTAVDRNPADRDNYLLWLSYFTKRFEVSKKLYTAYQHSSAKKASENCRDYLNYALLSLTLLYDYEWAGNLKMINTTLKLNDLLCSLRNELAEPEVLLATIIALNKEKNNIQQIMIDRQVAI